MTYLIQTTVFACLKNQSVAEVRFRDNFSVTSIFIVTAIFSVTENSSRAEFDSGFFSFQQPLRFATLSTSRCGSVTRGSDSPPGCHSLPLARLRLRLAYPLHGAGKRAYRFYMHYQLNSIIFCLFGCGFALPTPYTSAILRSCKARLLPSAAKQNFIFNRAAVK